MKIVSALLFLIVPLLSTTAPASCWKLPMEVNDTNTTVGFELDTTWHMVHGKVPNGSGKIWLSDPKDPTSINAELMFPVSKFDTDNSSRDETMREVMESEKFPVVKIDIRGMAENRRCAPSDVSFQTPCEALLLGSLNIHGVTRELKLGVQISEDSGGYKVSGRLPFDWASFGIEDPSIFIARVDPTVTVIFETRIPKA